MVNMYCPKCGKAIVEGGRYCQFCGCDALAYDPRTDTGTGPSASAGHADPHQSTVYYQRKDETAAMILALVFPGAGELYLGKNDVGLIMMVANLACFFLGWFISFIFIGCFVVWLYGLVDTHDSAREYNHTLDSTGRPPIW
jgi:TM2 domain-containing membrane protein YozV